MDRKNLLVVGGTGFIGRHLVKKAAECNYNVIVLSSKKHIEKLHSQTQNIDYITADIRDFKQLKKALSLSHREIHYVVNLGGYIDHVNFMSGGYSVINTHFNGVLNLVRCLDWSKIKGFVQIGSSDEYGNLKAPQSENKRERPISSYSLGKVAANQFLQMLNREEDFPIVILRLFLVYGPGQNKKRFIPQIIQGCLKEESFPVSLGEQLRDFCYIDDVAQGILSAMKCSDAYGEIINIASGDPVKIREMIELIRNRIGKGSPQFGKVKYRKGENMALYADISKARKILSWRPATELSKGIDKTISYYPEADKGSGLHS
jgi:nucleoside-diphosphate-sugar epimerase